MRNLAQFGLGSCLLKILFDYLENRKQYVRGINTNCAVLEVSNGDPKGSLLGPILFFVFINDFTDILVFADPHFFDDDLKLLIETTGNCKAICISLCVCEPNGTCSRELFPNYL